MLEIESPVHCNDIPRQLHQTLRTVQHPDKSLPYPHILPQAEALQATMRYRCKRVDGYTAGGFIQEEESPLCSVLNKVYLSHPEFPETQMEQSVKRTQREYSLSFKLTVVDQIEQGELTYKQAKS